MMEYVVNTPSGFDFDNYSDEEMVTLKLERYEKMREAINDLETTIESFGSCFRVDSAGNGVVVKVNKRLLEDWIKIHFDQTNIFKRIPVVEVIWEEGE